MRKVLVGIWRKEKDSVTQAPAVEIFRKGGCPMTLEDKAGGNHCYQLQDTSVPGRFLATSPHQVSDTAYQLEIRAKDNSN
jgi:hypothetical protein